MNAEKKVEVDKENLARNNNSPLSQPTLDVSGRLSEKDGKCVGTSEIRQTSSTTTLRLFTNPVVAVSTILILDLIKTTIADC